MFLTQCSVCHHQTRVQCVTCVLDMQVFLPEAVSQIRSAGAPHTSCVSSGDQTVNVSVVQLPSRLKVTEPLYQSKTKKQCALYSLQSEADQ